MADKHEIKVKKNEDLGKEIEAKNKSDEKWDIKIENDDQKIEFDKSEDGQVSTTKLKVRVKKKGENEKWQDGEVNVKMNKGFFRETYEIEKKDDKVNVYNPGATTVLVELKEVPKKLNTNIHSFKWGFYGLIVVVVIVVGFLVWWLISSNKNEDKEAESL